MTLFRCGGPELEKRIDTILKAQRDGAVEEKRDDRNLLEEIVGVVRALQMDQKDLQESIDFLGRRLSTNTFALSPPVAAMVELLQRGSGGPTGVAAAAAPTRPGGGGILGGALPDDKP